ncbi:MAG: DNA polymerase I [Bdellovibrionales bacterium]|jgi:DNA polymerase-1|nr:DNA polymerase I [Bdellovibrionales bacterium]
MQPAQPTQGKRSLYLVDVSSMIFRAFYAVRPLTSPQGLPVNAIYGFLTMTIKLIREIRPDYLAFCFDRPEPSFRKALDERYKANRTEMPEDLVPQMPWFRKLSEALGISCFDKESFEADDLIGTLACEGRAHGLDVVIVSGDKDFAQLIQTGITLYDTMKDVRYDTAAALEKWGVPPGQMIDFLAMVGDSSDNVPGVSGIGPKGAQKLLTQFATLEEVYEKLEEVKPDSARKKLEASRDDAFLSKKLVTIVCDVPLDYELENLKMKEINREHVASLFEELGFKSLSKQLLGVTPNPAPSPVSEEAQTAPVPVSASSPVSAPMSETQGVPNAPSPLEPGPYWADSRLEISNLIEKLKRLPLEKEIWVVHSERGVIAGFEGNAYQLAGNPEDLALALEGRRLAGFDLKDFAHRYGLAGFVVTWDAKLGAYVEHARAVETVHELFTNYLGLSLPDLASASQWLAWHFALRRAIETKLERQNGARILQDFELPLVPILYRMERKGILIDRPLLAAYSKELGADVQTVEVEIHRDCGEVFNIGSPKQLGQILFGKMGLPSGKKTKTGFSTDNEVLEAIDHPVAQKILLWRELTKLKSTYVDAIPALADEHGRVHTTFNQALTSTGRLSSTAPNLQNIPIRTERGAHIRRGFIAPEGRVLLSADYSQIELRVLAQITEDPGLVRAFEQGLDIHAATAAEIFEVQLSDVTAEMRRQAKAVNFGLAYGQGAFGLAETLGVPRGEAQAIIGRYFMRFAKVKDYMTETVESAKKNGFVETLFGRRRYITEFDSKNAAVRKFGERAAINAPIQGAASDLVKKAMIEVDRKLSGRSDVDMLLQVHDELVFEVAAGEAVEGLSGTIKETMESVVSFKVPLVANIGIGANWQDAH